MNSQANLLVVKFITVLGFGGTPRLLNLHVIINEF